MKSKKRILAVAMSGCMLAGMAGTSFAGGMGKSASELRDQVRDQQQQLDAQAAELAQMKEKLDSILGKTAANQEALASKVDKKEIEDMKLDSVVFSSKKDVDVTLYGQVNRGILWADNGDASKAYFVDNKNSSSRMGINAKAKATSDITLGSKLEAEWVTNSNNDVNQDSESSDAKIDIRHVDAYMESETFGKVSVGQGSTASDNSAEQDLSGTAVITGSAANYNGGGQFWYDDTTDLLSDSKVKNVVDNMDGLSRHDRVRYDSPSFAGITLSGSAIEEGAFDAAISYSQKFDGVKLAAAAAYATPGDLASWDHQIDGSLSALLDSGFNFTLAGGQQSMDIDDRDDPTYWFAKLGYQASIFSAGKSSFSVDYGQWNDLQVNDDEADSWCAAFVQEYSDWGTEFYLAYRWYQLDRTDTDYSNVNTVLGGARIKF